jgi:transposase-like protein
MRTRIARYAKQAKRLEGQTFKETAEKLGIGTRTLRRYRKGYEGGRGEGQPEANLPDTNAFPEVSDQIKRRMKRGGKLTQLRQNLKERNQARVPPEAPQPPEGVAFDLEDAQIRTPDLATRAVNRVGREDTPSLDRAIIEDTPVRVEMRKVRSRSGQVRWEIGESDRTELIDTVTFEIDTTRVLDSVELVGILWERIMPIIYDNRE